MNLRRRRLPLGRRSLLIVGAMATLFAMAVGSGSGALPTGFQESTAFTGLVNPSAIEFASDGVSDVTRKRSCFRLGARLHAGAHRQ